jgi:hypothetical protein
MTYWQGLVIGGIAFVVGFLGHWKVPKDSIWWPVAVLVYAVGLGMFAVSSAHLYLAATVQ